MSDFRDIKRKARRLLHERLQLAAIYVADKADWVSPIKEVSVRIHYSFGKLGGLKGTSFHTVQEEEVKPLAIFLVAEVPKPKRNAYISIDLGEAYLIDNINPPDDLTVTAYILKATKVDANLMPLIATYVADPINAPEIERRVVVRIDYLIVPNRIVFLPAEIPVPVIGASVTIREGLSFSVTSVSPTKIEIT